MRIYAKLLHVSDYYLFDPVTGVLEGYELDQTTRAYRRLPPLPDGNLACPALGLRVGVRHGRYQGVEADWLRWISADGHVLPTAEEDAERFAKRAEQVAKERRRCRPAAGRGAGGDRAAQGRGHLIDRRGSPLRRGHHPGARASRLPRGAPARRGPAHRVHQRRRPPGRRGRRAARGRLPRRCPDRRPGPGWPCLALAARREPLPLSRPPPPGPGRRRRVHHPGRRRRGRPGAGAPLLPRIPSG